MSLFLDDSERSRIVAARATPPLREFYWALVRRVDQRVVTPGLIAPGTTCDWWHCAAEYLTDAAMVWALRPNPPLAAWMRSTVLDVVRRPLADWIGPDFRDHQCQPPQGHLETAHLAWGIAVCRDLTAPLFTEAELSEMDDVLRRHGMALCQRWLDTHDHVSNWRCVMNAGVAVTAAVLNDSEAMAQAAAEFRRNADFFQPDGSFGESLQYGNYAASALVLTREALVRRQPALAAELPLTPWIGKVRNDAAALLHTQPLAGWSGATRARSVNFGDSAAIYRPSADVLLYIAARGREHHPREAGLARSLFDRLYTPEPHQGPHDRASFGFVNDFGFLTPLLLPHAASALSPAEAGLGNTVATDAGDVIARDSWPGRTTLAVRTGGAPLRSIAHLHGDLLSGILTHRAEGLLVDAGHSCYRNHDRELDRATANHSTCTFAAQNTTGAWQQIGQRLPAQRRINRATGGNQPPVPSLGRLLLAAEVGEFRAVVAEASAAYGEPLQEFRRCWIMGGSQTVFVVDRIVSAAPVRATWHWLLNNREAALELKLFPPDRLVARRNGVGLKLFHSGGGQLQSPMHSRVHDAYHPLPGGPGEGASGSGALVRWTEAEAKCERTIVHAICLDEAGAIAGWHYHADAAGFALEAPARARDWRIAFDAAAQRIELRETVGGASAVLAVDAAGDWSLG